MIIINYYYDYYYYISRHSYEVDMADVFTPTVAQISVF